MMKTPLSASLASAMLLSGAVLAQGPTLLKDINATQKSATSAGVLLSPKPFAAIGAGAAFSGQNWTDGIELWYTDGTINGVNMVWDPIPGDNKWMSLQGGNPNELVVLGGKVYYTYLTPTYGRELWVWDPAVAASATNPKLVKDITPGSAPQSNSGVPNGLFTYNGFIYFLADDGVNGQELWTTNGTAAGTFMVYESIPGPGTLFQTFFMGPPAPTFVVHSSGVLYFTANGQLFRFVGIPTAYTVQALDAANPVQGSINGLTPHGPDLYFVADSLGAPSFGTDRELYKFDTTTNTIVLVKDINPGTTASGNPQNLTSWGANLMFSANDGVAGTELWISDGTTAGTQLLADIRAGSSSSFPGQMWVHNTGFYFTANDGINGQELWTTDGTMVGTVQVQDIRIGSGSGVGSTPYYCSLSPTQFVFTANDGSTGSEPFLYDSAASPKCSLILDIRPGTSGQSSAYYTQIASGAIVFAGNDGTTGTEVWKTDGTPGGTVLLKDAYDTTGLTNSSSPSYMTDTLKGFSLFTANDGVSGSELWRTDGTTAGTIQVADINPSSSSSPSGYSNYTGTYAVSGQYTYFQANDGTNGSELWRSTGIPGAGQTTMVADIRPGSSSGGANNLVSISGGRVVFYANDGTTGSELYVSDGVTTLQVDDINPGSNSASPERFLEWNGYVYFLANNLSPKNVYKWDGSTIWDGINPNPGITQVTAWGSPNVYNLNSGEGFVPFKGKLWIAYCDAVENSGQGELFSIDAADVVTKFDLNPGTTGSNPKDLTVWNGNLYFTADVGGGLGRELYRTDGTLSGTILVKDINTFPGSGAFNGGGEVFAVDNGLVLFADDGVNGRELWSSDGTPGLTFLLLDIAPGAETGIDGFGANIGTRKVFFRGAPLPTDGSEPWVTDGTLPGTFQIGDVSPGASRSSPIDWALVNGKLVFEATAPTTASELWVYNPGATSKAVGRSHGKPAEGFPTLTVSDLKVGGTGTIFGQNAKPGQQAFIHYMLPPYLGENYFAGYPYYWGVTPPNIYYWFSLPVLANGTYTVSLPIPATPALVGAPLGFSAYVGIAPTMPLGVTSTNAVYAWLGN